VRLLVVIPHYFGPVDAANSSPLSASYLEPLSRIAALSETITSLHRNFGPYRSTSAGAEIVSGSSAANLIDIVIVTIRERNILSELGLAPDIYTVEYVEGAPTQIPFHVGRIMRERAGRYDFYCLIEHDVAIHDPAFFEKLNWFRRNFGITSLLAPTRVETAATGTPGKVIVDPDLPEELSARFRRAGQRDVLQAQWNGQQWRFALPSNPHAGCFFLSAEQFAYWVAQPSFDERDASWVGPVESAVTLGIGKVFDIYKAVFPDPFFLEVHHFGAAYAGINPPHGRRHGDPPLLAIAEAAVRAVLESERGASTATADGGVPRHIRTWVSEGTVGERLRDAISLQGEWERKVEQQRAEIAALTDQTQRQTDAVATLAAHARQQDKAIAALTEQTRRQADTVAARIVDSDQLQTSIGALWSELHRREQSLRWLIKSLVREILRRFVPLRRDRGSRPVPKSVPDKD
jgi:hypothetical protein